MSTNSKRTLQGFFRKADIEVNGTRPWDIQVHDERFYDRMVSEGTLGAGESYMDGWWDVEALDDFCFRLLKLDIEKAFRVNWETLKLYANARLRNVQTRTGSRKVARVHYNLSNDFYMSWLGPYNQYTSLYYPKGTESFDEAEAARLDLICRKLQLSPSDTVLDIGCGWGGFARYAAEHFGCHVTGISIAEEQIAYAQQHTRGLPVEIRHQDYRDLVNRRGEPKIKFSKIFSGGMIEHVGAKNYQTYMRIVSACLSDDGLFVLDCLGENVGGVPDAWSAKYIFPNSHVPVISELVAATQSRFIMEDWHNFGADYDKTAVAWVQRFEASWRKIQNLDPKFDQRFYRMWRFYLLGGAAKLRARQLQQWQVVYSKGGLEGGYKSVR